MIRLPHASRVQLAHGSLGVGRGKEGGRQNGAREGGKRAALLAGQLVEEGGTGLGA